MPAWILMFCIFFYFIALQAKEKNGKGWGRFQFHAPGLILYKNGTRLLNLHLNTDTE
jgi:hypothetical protein